jgi:thioesterase domain-containing protein/acyl carrier protein
MLESEVLPPSVRLVVIGGEKASVEHAERWRRKVPGVRLVNTYGPTETTIIATASEDLATIGQPIANAYAYVLDGYRKLCPPGVIGELHIGGEPVAKGYLNREDLTAKAFLPDPFAAEIAVQVRQLGREPVSATAPTAGSARMYRTGDKVGLASGGQLWFFGRADGQVKISGFRIETDEIRQAVLGEQGVRDAAVVAIERPGAAESGRLELACYLVVTDPELDANRLRERIGQHLPEYMIPRHWVFVDAIPLNANGKVDRAALPPVPAEAAGAASCLDPEVNSTLELQIAAALRSALGIEHYDRNASFDALGGDSLSAIQFLLELEKLTGQPVSVEVLYQAQSMAALADAIEQLDDKPWSPFVQLRSGESGKPPLFLVHTTPGDVLGYINLVKYLDDRAVIGIQARGLDLSAEPATSIETMARDYVALVRDYLPAGPYYLSGWCYGGIVAHEMVAQLEQQGVEPGLFVAIETWGEPAPTLASTLRKLWNLITWGPRGWRGFAAAKWRRLLGGATVEDQDLDELDFIGRRFGSSRSTAELERMKALYTINTEAADRYRMPRIRAHVDLLMIKADANPGRVPDPTYWWRGIAPHRRIQTFDGDHATVLKEPAVRRIGQALVELLQLADRRVGAVAD